MSGPHGDEAQRRRLRWQCRRGLLELDLLFGRFLDRRYPDLAVAEQTAFRQLLDYPDAELLEWLAGRGEPPSELRNIIRILSQDIEYNS